MKKVFKRAIPLALAIVMCLCTAAPAFAAMPDENAAEPSTVVHCYKVTSSNGAYMREGPSTSYGLVAFFPRGTYLYYISYTTGTDGRTWIRLRDNNNTTGWIRADFVEYTESYVGS